MKKLTTLYSIIFIVYGLNAQNQSFFKNQQFEVFEISPTSYIFENDSDIVFVFRYKNAVGGNQPNRFYLSKYDKNGILINNNPVPLIGSFPFRNLEYIEHIIDNKYIVSVYETDGENWQYNTYFYDFNNSEFVWQLPLGQGVKIFTKISEDYILGLAEQNNVVDRNPYLLKINIQNGEYDTLSEFKNYPNVNVDWDLFSNIDNMFITSDAVFFQFSFNDFQNKVLFKINFEGHLEDYKEILFLDYYLSAVSPNFYVFVGFEDNNLDYNKILFTNFQLEKLLEINLVKESENQYLTIKRVNYNKKVDEFHILFRVFEEIDSFFGTTKTIYEGLSILNNNGDITRTLKFNEDINSDYAYSFPNIIKSDENNYFIGVCKYGQINDLAFIMKTDTCGNVEPGDWGVSFTQEDCGFVGVEDVIKPTESKIALYPNPNNGQFRTGNEELGIVEVYNLQGQKVHSQRITQVNELINLNQPLSGVYLLRFIQENGTVKNAKFVAGD